MTDGPQTLRIGLREKMIELIRNYWILALCGTAFGALGVAVRFLWRRVKYMNDGVVAILHDRLFQGCMHFLAQNEIGVEEMRNLQYLYSAYSGLGGNGTCEELFSRVKVLPIRH